MPKARSTLMLVGRERSQRIEDEKKATLAGKDARMEMDLAWIFTIALCTMIYERN
jgi:hypothetical protein